MIAVHSVSMFATMTLAALITFRVLGVHFLRRAWVNFDAIWIVALVLAGVVTLLAL